MDRSSNSRLEAERSERHVASGMTERNAGFLPAKDAIKIEKFPRSEILLKLSNATSDDFNNTTCPFLSPFGNTTSSRTTVTLAVSTNLFEL